MKFYKLELINREDSYNKMFGSNPNVGVLNPLTTNKPQTGKHLPLGIGSAQMGVNLVAVSGGKAMTQNVPP